MTMTQAELHRTMHEAAREMHALRDNWDIEAAHIVADELLCSLIEALGGEEAQEVVAEFNALRKWYA